MHRDIAVRNVLLGKDNSIKISDFGLARRLPEGQEYWALPVASDLPIRYMPPEAFDTRHFSQSTDVWSFGVAMWETMAYAAFAPCFLSDVSQLWAPALQDRKC